jgi:uncharacterized BrkB/YihY/UPF0761 family membrane protein/DNA-binding IscR family transcriptional regulator
MTQYSRDGFEKPEDKHSGVTEKALDFHERMKTASPEDVAGQLVMGCIWAYRLVFLLIDDIIQSELFRRAASLTYTTILSIFPLLAIIGFTASFFYDEAKEQEFTTWIQEQLMPSMETEVISFPMTEEMASQIESQQALAQNIEDLFVGVSSSFRESAGGAGIFGILGLLITCGILYMSIEGVVNQTWHTTHRIRWAQTLTNFVTVLISAPLIIGMSVAATGIAVMLLDENQGQKIPIQAVYQEETVFVGELSAEDKTNLEENVTETPLEEVAVEAISEVAIIEGAVAQEVVETSPPAVKEAKKPNELSPLMQKLRAFTTFFGFLLPIIPIMLNACMLSAAYSFIPRCKVQFRYAFLGGLMAALLWEAARYLFFYYVYASAINRTLAASLGAPVIFLLWIYITWIILLAGNLIVYISQNLSALWAEKMTEEQVLVDGRLLVGVMLLLARQFTSNRGGGLTENQIRLSLGLSQEYFQRLIIRLRRNRLITVLEGDAYQLGKPVSSIQVRDLMQMGCDLEGLPLAKMKGRVARAMSWLQERSVDLAGDDTLADVLKAQSVIERPTPHDGVPVDSRAEDFDDKK